MVSAPASVSVSVSVFVSVPVSVSVSVYSKAIIFEHKFFVRSMVVAFRILSETTCQLQLAHEARWPFLRVTD